MDKTSRWAMSSLARCNESKYHLPNGRACKLYVEQSMLFSLFLKKIIFNVCMLMDVLTFRWVTVIAKYLQSETVADLFYVTCFCSMYAWILKKNKLYFDFLVVFTPLLRPCQLLYHVSWLLCYWSLHFFFFFVLTSDRPLPVKIFFVFSKPLCSEDRDSGIFCTAAKAVAVKGLSTAAKICDCCSPALLQLFCSASWSCLFRRNQFWLKLQLHNYSGAPRAREARAWAEPHC